MKTKRWWGGAVIVALLVTWPASAVAATGSDRSDSIMLTGTIRVAEGETLGTVIAFDGPAVIDGTVDHVIAFNGDITVNGTVNETVVSFNGRANVSDTAVIHGDVYSRHTPVIDDGAQVHGETGRFDPAWFGVPFLVISRIAFWVAVSVSTLALGLFLVAFAPRAAEAAVSTAHREVGASTALGVALFFGLPIFAVIAMVTLVGIPLGVGLMLALSLIYAVGYVTSAWLVGRRFVTEPGRAIVAFLAGWGILRAVALVPVVGGLVWFAAAAFGLGVLTLQAFRARSPEGGEPAAAAGPTPA